MKYMNHLRKLALLSSLALSFSLTVQADGTLPLPFESNSEDLPIKLAADNSEVRLTIHTMENAPKPGVNVCGLSGEFYTATGELEGKNKFIVEGICKPKGVETLTRTLVAVNEETNTQVLLPGKLTVEKILNPVSGQMVPTTKSFTTTLGSSLAGPEAGNTVTLYRIR